MKTRVASQRAAELVALMENGRVDRAIRVLDRATSTEAGDFLGPWGSLRVTLVQLAAWSGSVEMLKRSRDLGADLNATDRLGRCALHHAAHQGHAEAVGWLLEHGATVESRFAISSVPKDEPCRVAGTAPPYLRVGRNLPLPECWGRTALHQAVRLGHTAVVRLLVDAGADVDARDERGVTPLHLAAVTVDPEDPEDALRFERVVDILASASASVNIPHPDTGTTALHHAATLGNRGAVRRLLESGASPAARCAGTGITPLHVAAGAGFAATLDLLLAHADASVVNARDEIGRTPLHAAAYRGHLECVRALVDHGGSLASKTKTGVTVMDAIFTEVARPAAFLVDLLDSRVRGTDRTNKQQVTLDFRILAPEGEPQMAVVSAVIGAVPFMEQITILHHPLVEAFLGMKWSRLRSFFFALVVVHVLFALSLSGYSMSLLRGASDPLPRRLLLFCACVSLCNDTLQLAIAPRVYARQFETWLSMVGVTLTIVVSVAGELGPPDPIATPRWILQSVSVAILFAWIQTMLLVGRFPTWGHYALMFSTVLKNVSKVLVAFVWLIVGFALSFAVLFRGNALFDGTWKAFVKTVVMMTGEFEYGDLFAAPADAESNGNSGGSQVDFSSLTGRLVFLVFVMLASIVLMNLTVGLAVSDIQGLLNEGHIRRLLKQAAFVAHLEWVTSHRIFANRYLKSILASENTIPTRVTLGTLTAYDKGVSGLSEELLEVLFTLASKNREARKESRGDSTREKNTHAVAATTFSPSDRVEALKANEMRLPGMPSTRNRNAERRNSVPA